MGNVRGGNCTTAGFERGWKRGARDASNGCCEACDCCWSPACAKVDWVLATVGTEKRSTLQTSPRVLISLPEHERPFFHERRWATASIDSRVILDFFFVLCFGAMIEYLIQPEQHDRWRVEWTPIYPCISNTQDSVRDVMMGTRTAYFRPKSAF